MRKDTEEMSRMTTKNFKDAVDSLVRSFYNLSREKPVNIYMNKDQLEQFNIDLKADKDRDLKKYQGCNIIIWDKPFISLGYYDIG